MSKRRNTLRVVVTAAVMGLVGGLLLAIPIDLLIWSFADHFLIRPRRDRIVTTTTTTPVIGESAAAVRND